MKLQDILEGLSQSEINAKFNNLADSQRGIPEITMTKIQNFAGGGVLPHLLEHIGDLTHRMSQKYVTETEIENAIEYLNPKIKSALLSLRGNNFVREVQENTRSNYKYFVERKEGFKEKYPKIEDFLKEYTKLLNDYATAHAKLPVYNQAQLLAREAAVALGHQRYADCEKYLTKLDKMINETGMFSTIASQYNPKYETRTARN